MKLIVEISDEKWQRVKDGTWCGSEEIANGEPYYGAEPCSDAISRQAAVDWLTDRTDLCDAIGHVIEKEEMRKEIAKLMAEIPPATPKAEPCEDVISRQAVLALPRSKVKDLKTMEVVCETINVTDIETLPSVTPKQSENTMMDAAIDEWRGEMDNAIKRALEKQIEILDKIRAEIRATAELHIDGDYYLRDEWIDEIFDKYTAESEDES